MQHLDLAQNIIDRQSVGSGIDPVGFDPSDSESNQVARLQLAIESRRAFLATTKNGGRQKYDCDGNNSEVRIGEILPKVLDRYLLGTRSNQNYRPRNPR